MDKKVCMKRRRLVLLHLIYKYSLILSLLFIYQELVYRGRIRVQLKNDDGTALNPEFPNRDAILLHCGKMIPQLKSRQTKQPGEQQATTSQQSQGKKGKGKRR